MNRHKRQLGLLLALLFLGLSTPLQAMPRLGAERQGVILKIDLNAKQMQMRRADTSENISFTWNRRTVFVARGAIAGPSALKPGDRVKVIYHRPVFGRPFVTRVRVAP